MIDVLTLALANKYTDTEIAGGGAIKGAPCEIDSISDGVVTFKWEDTQGDTQYLALDVGEAIAEKLAFAISADGQLTVTTED